MYSKILVINLGGIGDVLLSTPALRAIAGLCPDGKLSVLAVSRAEDIVKNLPYVAETFILRKNIPGLRTLLSLRSKKFSLVINMRTITSRASAFKLKILLGFIAAQSSCGRDTNGRGYFFDIKVPETDPGQKYEMEYDIDTARLLGASVAGKTIDFNLSAEHTGKMEVFLKNKGVVFRTVLIGIHLGGRPACRWPVERFSKVIDAINSVIPAQFVITGSKEESIIAGELKRITKTSFIDYSGTLNVKELGALIKRCNIFISADTGPMHIAAVLKTPLIAIFSSGEITRYDPRNISDKAIVLYKKIACSPCNKMKCASQECVKNITVEEVTEAALSLLKMS